MVLCLTVFGITTLLIHYYRADACHSRVLAGLEDILSLSLYYVVFLGDSFLFNQENQKHLCNQMIKKITDNRFYADKL